VVKSGAYMKDLVDIMKENKQKYYGITQKMVKQMRYNMFKIGEKSVMPIYIDKESNNES
jgi:hypothetical protein